MLDTRRRHFITLLGGAAAWPLPGRAQQQTKIARIGILGLASAAAVAPYVNAVRAGLRDLGYIEGKNLIIEYRFGDGNYDRLPDLARQLVHLNVDGDVCGTGNPSRQIRHIDYPHSNGGNRRRCRYRTHCQPRSPRWQCHRNDRLKSGTHGETP